MGDIVGTKPTNSGDNNRFNYWDIQKRLDRWDARLKTLEDKIDWMWMCLRQANVPWQEYIAHPLSPWNKQNQS